MRLAIVIALSCWGCARAHVSSPWDSGPPTASPDVGVSCEARAETCNGVDDDCDAIVDEDADSMCESPYTVLVCRAARCVVESCDDGYADCDGLVGNGCETSTATDHASCGACGASCALREICVDSACVDDPIADVDPAMITFGCMALASGRVICWGRNYRGAFRRDGIDEVFEPVEVVGLPPIREIEVGGLHTCALARDGGVWCWGSNVQGRLGQGHADPVFGFARVPLPRAATQIELDESFSCALLDDQSAWCWGVAQDGSVVVPGPIAGIPPARALSSFHALTRCVIDEEGWPWCWGENESGRFGISPRVVDWTVVPVQGGRYAPLTDMRCGASHCCGLHPGGTVSCWGRSLHGSLGNGGVDEQIYPPTLVEGPSDIVAIAAASTEPLYSASCALDAAGQLWCWGGGGMDGLGVTALLPTLVLLPARATALHSSGRSLCVTMGSSRLSCWGRNEDGQLGDGTLASRGTPAPVVGFE